MAVGVWMDQDYSAFGNDPDWSRRGVFNVACCKANVLHAPAAASCVTNNHVLSGGNFLPVWEVSPIKGPSHQSYQLLPFIFGY